MSKNKLRIILTIKRGRKNIVTESSNQKSPATIPIKDKFKIINDIS